MKQSAAAWIVSASIEPAMAVAMCLATAIVAVDRKPGDSTFVECLSVPMRSAKGGYGNG